MMTHSSKVVRVQGTVLDSEKNTKVHQIYTLPQGEMNLNNSFFFFCILFKNCYVEYPNFLNDLGNWHNFSKQVPLSEFSLPPPPVLSYGIFIYLV